MISFGLRQGPESFHCTTALPMWSWSATDRGWAAVMCGLWGLFADVQHVPVTRHDVVEHDATENGLPRGGLEARQERSRLVQDVEEAEHRGSVQEAASCK
eukprot:1191949-Prorocentrum_minimum.AAC.2